MKVKNIHETVKNNYIDFETGEVVETDIDLKIHKVVVNSKETLAFVSSVILGLFDDLDGTELKLITYCAVNAEYNSNTVNLTKPMCQLISDKLQVGYQTIKNTISKLKKKNVLIPLGSGTYRVNPKYAWKGTTDERKKMMKYILEIECPDCY